MRLICPVCQAAYAVDASMVPPAGRDVRCSNCNHGWRASASAAPMPDSAPVPEGAPAAPITDGPAAVNEDAGGTASDVAVGDRPDDDSEEDGIAPAALDGPVPRREIDPGALRILREEARRESLARAAAAERAVAEARDAALADGPAGRSDEPDIVEVMSAMRPAAPGDGVAARSPEGRRNPSAALGRLAEPAAGDRAARRRAVARAGRDDTFAARPRQPPPRSGFGTGFAVILLVAAVAVGVYLAAPQIIRTFPGAAPTVTDYVAAVDRLRIAVDRTAGRAEDWARQVFGGRTPLVPAPTVTE